MTFVRLTLTGSLALLFVGCGTHGTDDKSKSDGTYSTHNYKHPNKAAEASTWEQSPTVLVRPDTNRNSMATSYKQLRPGTGQSGGLVIPYTYSATMADRHYKTQNWLTNQLEPVVAKTPASAPDQPSIGH